MGRAYTGVYGATKAALNALVQTYAAETATTNARVNAFNPGPTRTRMYASGWPGVDPATLTPPEDIAKAVLPLCLPDCAESGKIYDYRAGKFLTFQPPL
jgi:NAD(P)-dependent dehydrogenase (short-subunit alcohol dehydrogenase family)